MYFHIIRIICIFFLSFMSRFIVIIYFSMVYLFSDWKKRSTLCYSRLIRIAYSFRVYKSLYVDTQIFAIDDFTHDDILNLRRIWNRYSLITFRRSSFIATLIASTLRWHYWKKTTPPLMMIDYNFQYTCSIINHIFSSHIKFYNANGILSRKCKYSVTLFQTIWNFCYEFPSASDLRIRVIRRWKKVGIAYGLIRSASFVVIRFAGLWDSDFKMIEIIQRSSMRCRFSIDIVIVEDRSVRENVCYIMHFFKNVDEVVGLNGNFFVQIDVLNFVNINFLSRCNIKHF